MVDAPASLQATAEILQRRSGVRGAGQIVVEIGDGAGVLASYAVLAGRGLGSPAQSPIWIGRWIEALSPDHLVATLTEDGQPAFALALEIVRQGPFRIARFMGGHHANGNFPVMTASFAASATAAGMEAVTQAIRRARPDVDLLSLERLATEMGGTANPLLALPHLPSPNISLAVDLVGGFDALLGRASGKRKRKKHRSQTRKFEAVGGFRRIEARTEAETNALLDAFFVMKEARFRKMGIANVFAEAAVQRFFRSIFADALREPEPSFKLHALEVGGRIRAVTGSSRCGDRLICEFGAIGDDDLAHASPGEYLFFENIQEACEDGFAVYDFSVGDEPYKRLWCNIEIGQCDALLPLTAKGWLLAASMRLLTRLKFFIKNNRFVWKLAKTLRRKAAAQAAPAADDSE